MIRFGLLVQVLAGCVLVAGCGGRATPDPAVVAKAVEATLTAQVTSTPTPASTDTPTPRPSNTPTRRPTSTPTPRPTPVPKPEGWKSYKLIGSRSTVWYPPEWEIEDEDERSLVLSNGLRSIFIDEFPMIDPNQSTEALVSDLKRILLNTDTTGRDTFKFTTEGRLIARNSPAVVAFLRKDYITGIEIAGALSYFTDGRNVAMIHYLTTTAGDNVDAMIGIIEHYDFGE